MLRRGSRRQYFERPRAVPTSTKCRLQEDRFKLVKGGVRPPMKDLTHRRNVHNKAANDVSLFAPDDSMADSDPLGLRWDSSSPAAN